MNTEICFIHAGVINRKYICVLKYPMARPGAGYRVEYTSWFVCPWFQGIVNKLQPVCTQCKHFWMVNMGAQCVRYYCCIVEYMHADRGSGNSKPFLSWITRTFFTSYIYH